jgi:hypothetical protein
VAHAEVGEGVDHRVLHGRWRADRPRLGDALGAERVVRGAGLHEGALEARQLAGADDRVVGERGGERVGVLVVGELLEEGLGHALGGAAVDLPGGEERVEDGAGVVDRDEAPQAHQPGVDLHLDDRHVGAGGEGGGDLHLGLAPEAVVGEGGGDLGPRHGAGRGPGDVEAPTPVEVDHHVPGARLQEVGGDLPGPLDEEVRSRGDGGTGLLHGAGPAGDAALRDHVGVAVDHPDALHGDARAVGDEHGPRRVVALAVGVGAGADEGGAVGQELDAAVLGAGHARGPVDEGGDADAELDGVAGRPPGRLLGPQVLVAGDGEGPLEPLGVAAAVVDELRRRGVRELVRADEVVPAQLRRVHPDLGCEQVDGPLEQRGGLGPTGAPVGGRRRRARHHAHELPVDAPQPVGARRQHAGVAAEHGPDLRVGAGVDEDAHGERLEGAVPPAAEGDVLDLGAPVPRPTMSSERSAVHRTGLPTRRASHGSSRSSGYGRPLAPKLPPTSGAMTRTCSTGRS